MAERKTCEICGKEFITSHGAMTCSPECRRKRKAIESVKYNQNNRDWYRKYHRQYYQERLKDKRREQYKDPNSTYRKYKDANKEAFKQKRRLRSMPKTSIEVDGTQVVMYECERLRVKFTRPPCGDRWECWDKEPCRFIPRGKTELSFQSEVLGIQYRPFVTQKQK